MKGRKRFLLVDTLGLVWGLAVVSAKVSEAAGAKRVFEKVAAALPRWRLGTFLGGLHLALMCVTVIVTGNHYVLDIVGGFIVAGSAIAVMRLFSSAWVRRWWSEWWRGRVEAGRGRPNASTRSPVDSS